MLSVDDKVFSDFLISLKDAEEMHNNYIKPPHSDRVEDLF